MIPLSRSNLFIHYKNCVGQECNMLERVDKLRIQARCTYRGINSGGGGGSDHRLKHAPLCITKDKNLKMETTGKLWGDMIFFWNRMNCNKSSEYSDNEFERGRYISTTFSESLSCLLVSGNELKDCMKLIVRWTNLFMMFHSHWTEEQTCEGNVQKFHKQHELPPTDVPPHWPPYLVHWTEHRTGCHSECSANEIGMLFALNLF